MMGAFTFSSSVTVTGALSTLSTPGVGALATILAGETAGKFLRNDKPYLPSADPAFCLQRDLFDFALRAQVQADGVESIRVS